MNLINVSNGDVKFFDNIHYVERLKANGLDLVVVQQTAVADNRFNLLILDDKRLVQKIQTDRVTIPYTEEGITLNKPVNLEQLTQSLATNKNVPESIKNLLIVGLADASEYLHNKKNNPPCPFSEPSQMLDDVFSNLKVIEKAAGDISGYIAIKAALRFVQVTGVEANEIYNTTKFDYKSEYSIIGFDERTTELIIKNPSKDSNEPYRALMISTIGEKVAIRPVHEVLNIDKEVMENVLNPLIEKHKKKDESKPAEIKSTPKKFAYK